MHGSAWAKDRPREVIEESIKNSLCFGVYETAGRKQIGFARIVTDKATFSWLCDVFIEETHRKKGVGTWLISCVIEHPSVKNTVSLLGTQDAHLFYEKHRYVRSEQMKRLPAEKSP